MSAYVPPADPTNILPKRYGAAVIDVVILWIVWIIAFVIGFAVFSHRVTYYDYSAYYGYTPRTQSELTGAGWLFVLVIGLTYMIGVFVIWRGQSGKSPGTAMLGLSVVNEQGESIGAGRALLRSVAGVVDYIGICSVPIVGLATTASSKGHRRVGDMAANSYVVETANAGRPIALDAAATGPYGQPYGQPAYGQPAYGQPAPPYGQPAYGQASPPPPSQTSPYPPAGGTSPFPPTPTTAPAADQAGWGAPGSTPPTPAPSAAPAPAPTPDPAPVADPTQPHWDPARNAYLQWDPTGQRWMQFDDATQQWRSIS